MQQSVYFPHHDRPSDGMEHHKLLLHGGRDPKQSGPDYCHLPAELLSAANIHQ